MPATGEQPRRDETPARRRPSFWVPAIVVAVGIHTAAFAVLGVSSGHSEPKGVAARGVRWVGEQADDAIEVRDPKAIFLPTRWNAATQETGASDNRGPGEIFPLEVKPALVATGSSPAGLVVMPEGPRTAGVALRRFSRPYVAALGQVDVALLRLPVRAALLEVRGGESLESFLRIELTATAITAAGADAGKWPLWAPFELLLAVEPTGTLGPPLVLSPGSGVEAVDEFFRTALRTMVRPDLVLPAGYYRVLVGP